MAIYSLTNQKSNASIMNSKILIIMDEFQNYSEMFKETSDGKESEMSLVSNKLLNNQDVKILMLSATPFKYSTKLDQYEQKISKMEKYDGNSDGNSNEEVIADTGLRQINQEFNVLMTYIGGKDFLEKWDEINKEKIEKINEEDSKAAKEKVRCQEELLYSKGISRVERNNHNLNNGDNVVANAYGDRLFFEDLLEVPKLEEKWIREIQDGDVVYLLEGRAYVERGNNYFVTPYVPEILAYEEDGKYVIRYDCVKDKETCNHIKNCDLNCDYCFPGYEAKEISDNEIKKISNMLDSKNVALSHYKDTPFLFSFSSGYKTISVDSNSPGFKIDYSDILNFRELVTKHSRYQKLKETLLSENENLLLFIPPSRPHYKLTGIFEEYDNINNDKKKFYSKTLIFSHYNHTPKALSALLSYESSRKTVTSETKASHNYWGNVNDGFEKRKLHYLNDQLKGDSLNVWAMENKIYQEEYKRYIQELKTSNYQSEVKKDNVHDRNRIICGSIIGYFYDFCKSILGMQEESSGFEYRVQELARKIYKVFETSDAYDVLNLIYPNNLGYQEKVWQYCTDGNIRAVLDEYIAMIYEDKELDKKDPDSQYAKLLNIFSEARENMNEQYVEAETTKTKIKMWTGFARGHYQGDKVGNSSDANTLNRKIAGFNSPFRPFVFITTSVGQEGFDFHWYCRNIVHWSLTFDPVKFEQRDGRINRYHCHYIRQNAALYKNQPTSVDNTYWKELFKNISEGNEVLIRESGGLYPHWEYPLDNKASKLQNIRFIILKVVRKRDMTKYLRHVVITELC